MGCYQNALVLSLLGTPTPSFPLGVHLLNSEGPPETCSRERNGQWQLIQSEPADPVSKAIFSLLSEPEQPAWALLLLLS